MERRDFLKGMAAVGGAAWTAQSTDASKNESPTPSLPTRPLGDTGVDVTVLALGGFTGMKEQRT